MDPFVYRGGHLWAEGVAVADLAATYGTPLYVYSRGYLRGQYGLLARELAGVSPLICFAVKSNSNGAVINTLARAGSGADVVSGGELYRALRAGVAAEKIVFAGVGKTSAEIDYALKVGIKFFTVESEPELRRINERALALNRKAKVALRVNPAVDPGTHHHTSTGKKESKFGIAIERIEGVYAEAAALPGLEIVGLHMHLGSPIMTAAPYIEALAAVVPLCQRLQQRYGSFRFLDIGGGFGIPYRDEQAPFDFRPLAEKLVAVKRETGLEIVVEPGRFFTGNAGGLVCRVQYLKRTPAKNFVITDAGMNDLIRPALYEAWHNILAEKEGPATLVADVVGPVCESGDFFVRGRELPEVAAGDLLMIGSAGAYGYAMASNYNSRPRAAEVLVDGDRHCLVRARETWEDFVRGEVIPLVE